VGVNAGVVKYDSTASVYTRVPANYVASPYSFSATLPGAGVYLIAGVNETVEASATVGAAFKVFSPAQANQGWQGSVAAKNDLYVQFNSSTQNNITVTPKQQPSYTPITNKSLGVWWSIELDAQATQQSQIKYTCTQAQLQAAGGAAAVGSNLRLAYYDTTATAWQFINSGYTIDVNARVIVATTTHFSEWGVYYTSASATLQAQFGAIILLMLALLLL